MQQFCWVKSPLIKKGEIKMIDLNKIPEVD